MAALGEQQITSETYTFMLNLAVEETPVKFAFDEYLEQRFDITDPIVVKDYLPRVFAIAGHPEPTYDSLFRLAKNPPTDEPWAEVLFAFRVKRHLESRDTQAVECQAADYWLLDDAERRNARAEDLKRYEFVLSVLRRMQENRQAKILADLQKRINNEVALVRGEETPKKK